MLLLSRSTWASGNCVFTPSTISISLKNPWHRRSLAMTANYMFLSRKKVRNLSLHWKQSNQKLLGIFISRDWTLIKKPTRVQWHSFELKISQNRHAKKGRKKKERSMSLVHWTIPDWWRKGTCIETNKMRFRQKKNKRKRDKRNTRRKSNFLEEVGVHIHLKVTCIDMK